MRYIHCHLFRIICECVSAHFSLIFFVVVAAEPFEQYICEKNIKNNVMRAGYGNISIVIPLDQFVRTFPVITVCICKHCEQIQWLCNVQCQAALIYIKSSPRTWWQLHKFIIIFIHLCTNPCLIQLICLLCSWR